MKFELDLDKKTNKERINLALCSLGLSQMNRSEIYGCGFETVVLRQTVRKVQRWRFRKKYRMTVSQCDCYYNLHLVINQQQV